MDDLLQQHGIGFGYGGMLPGHAGEEGTLSKKTNASVGKKRRHHVRLLETGAGTGGMAVNEATGCIEFPTLQQVNDTTEGTGGNLSYDKSFLDIDTITAQYGEKIANGYDQAMGGLDDLDGEYELLKDIFLEAADKLSVPSKVAIGLPAIVRPVSERVKNINNPHVVAYLNKAFGEEIIASFDQVISGLKDISNCDEVVKAILAMVLQKASPSLEFELGLISTS